MVNHKMGVASKPHTYMYMYKMYMYMYMYLLDVRFSCIPVSLFRLPLPLCLYYETWKTAGVSSYT